MTKTISAVLLLLAWALPLSAQVRPSNTDRQIAHYQALVSASADNSSYYDRLGVAYLQKGRETSDATYYDLAEKALNRSLQLASPLDMSASAPLMHLAEFCMAEHQFTQAVDYAQRSLALGSGDLSPFALLGDAHTDMGEYDQAAVAYAKLKLSPAAGIENRSLSYMRDIRVSYLEFLRGNNAAAVALATNAVLLAVETHMPGENAAWTYYQLGELSFLSGNLAAAEAAYQQSLLDFPGFYRALGGMAKVRVAQQRYPEGVKFYKQAIEVIPFPDYIAALGDVYTKLGQTKEAHLQYQLVEYIGSLNALNKRAYNRELAVFYADHNTKLNESRELAVRELEVRRDVYTEDVLAWSLYKNGQLKEAAAASQKAMHLDTQDPLLLFHAGMIRRDLGDLEGAKRLLQQALAINPQFHIFYADEARRVLQQMDSPGTNARLGGAHP